MSETPSDLNDAEQALRAVSGVSLRFMAGTVSKAKMEQLRRTVEQSGADFPWQVITQTVLAEDVDEQRLVQQGLVAQRDWILRGGRTARGPSITHRTKGFVARMTAQLIFGAIFVAVILIALLVLKYKDPEFDIYRILSWIQDLFGK
jgi:hypothetical protein